MSIILIDINGPAIDDADFWRGRPHDLYLPCNLVWMPKIVGVEWSDQAATSLTKRHIARCWCAGVRSSETPYPAVASRCGF